MNPAPDYVDNRRGISLSAIWAAILAGVILVLFLDQYPYATAWYDDWRFDGRDPNFEGENDMLHYHDAVNKHIREEEGDNDDPGLTPLETQSMQKQYRDRVIEELRHPIRSPWETLVYLHPIED